MNDTGVSSSLPSSLATTATSSSSPTGGRPTTTSSMSRATPTSSPVNTEFTTHNLHIRKVNELQELVKLWIRNGSEIFEDVDQMLSEVQEIGDTKQKYNELMAKYEFLLNQYRRLQKKHDDVSADLEIAIDEAAETNNRVKELEMKLQEMGTQMKSLQMHQRSRTANDTSASTAVAAASPSSSSSSSYIHSAEFVQRELEAQKNETNYWKRIAAEFANENKQLKEQLPVLDTTGIERERSPSSLTQISDLTISTSGSPRSTVSTRTSTTAEPLSITSTHTTTTSTTGSTEILSPHSHEKLLTFLARTSSMPASAPATPTIANYVHSTVVSSPAPTHPHPPALVSTTISAPARTSSTVTSNRSKPSRSSTSSSTTSTGRTQAKVTAATTTTATATATKKKKKQMHTTKSSSSSDEDTKYVAQEEEEDEMVVPMSPGPSATGALRKAFSTGSIRPTLTASSVRSSRRLAPISVKAGSNRNGTSETVTSTSTSATRSAEPPAVHRPDHLLDYQPLDHTVQTTDQVGRKSAVVRQKWANLFKIVAEDRPGLVRSRSAPRVSSRTDSPRSQILSPRTTSTSSSMNRLRQNKSPPP